VNANTVITRCGLLFVTLILATGATMMKSSQADESKPRWSPWQDIGYGLSFSWARVKQEKDGNDLLTWAVRNGNSERASGSLIITAQKADGTTFEVKGFEPTFDIAPGSTMGGWAAYTVNASRLTNVKIADLKIGKKVVVKAEEDR
jgi:hypothetical protein